jgi:hypothetical protein
MADFPSTVDPRGTSPRPGGLEGKPTPTPPSATQAKNQLNTHSAQLNIPSKLELETGTVVRILSGAAGFGIGKLKDAFDKPDYEWKKEGERAQRQWASERDDGTQPRGAENVGNDPYKAEGEDVEDHQKSLWFPGVRVIDSLVMSFDAFSTDKWIEAGNREDEYPASAIIIQNVLMNIQQKKNIVRTQIAGSDGRVKQYINLDDYEVSFTGRILGYDGYDDQGGEWMPGERPEEAIRAFVNFMEAPAVLAIGQDLLEIVKITRGVIGDFKLAQEIGRLDNQSFSFKLYSDNPFKIIIQDV